MEGILKGILKELLEKFLSQELLKKVWLIVREFVFKVLDQAAASTETDIDDVIVDRVKKALDQICPVK